MGYTSTKSSFLRVVLLVFVAVASVGLNGRPTRAQEQHALEAKTELVKLDVTVLRRGGEFVDGLDAKNFRVLDDGEERPIVFFAPVTAPAKVVVILETSPAVYLFQDEHLAAAYSLLEGLAPDDEVGLVTYADVPQSVVPLTTNRQQLLGAIENVQYMIGPASLNLYDSIGAVVDGIAAFPGKKALVLLTTGLDSSPPDRWDALTRNLCKADAVIFAVGLGGALRNGGGPKLKSAKKSRGNSGVLNDSPTELDLARNNLLTLSAMTGGRAYFPASGDEFESAYRQIASALRHEYVVGIAPQHDGQVHTLSVDVLDAGGAASKKKRGQPPYSVSARQRYIAPGSTPR